MFGHGVAYFPYEFRTDAEGDITRALGDCAE